MVSLNIYHSTGLGGSREAGGYMTATIFRCFAVNKDHCTALRPCSTHHMTPTKLLVSVVKREILRDKIARAGDCNHVPAFAFENCGYARTHAVGD